ncbi:hypothetical protein [Peribacillus sp. AS_2]|uniref:hypothetical protein n=1 Tax=Peribacillus sp. AS_2 TaxID=2996755 RepID=UPI0022A68EB2|nr:hypothetical protein [Peribacillus sp. AS_2]MCZ0872770.1 hypothetical protein [Peribacillus sp. AS_2]
MNNFQRENAISNAHVGRDFEEVALNFFKIDDIILIKGVSIPVGAKTIKKNHVFDLGSAPTDSEKIIVECKSHKWTSGGNVPSAKLTVWNEAMYYFFLAPSYFRKIFFILRDYNEKRRESLGEYYIRTYKHLIPEGVEIMEYDNESNLVRPLKI